VEGCEDWSRNNKSIYEKYVYPFNFELDGKQFCIVQDNVIRPEDLGNTVWDGSLVLSRYFANRSVFKENHWVGKRVIEVGSGTGVAGITLAYLGANVIMTDQEAQVQLIRSSIQKNASILKATPSAHELLWGEPLDSKIFKAPFDIVVASECIYYEDLVEPLYKTLLDLTDENSQVFVSYEPHNPDGVDLFLKTVGRGFNFHPVSEETLDPNFRSNRIKVLVMTRKKNEIGPHAAKS